MKRIRNFTGDDLALAERQMQDAYADYLAKKDSYDYSMSVGHSAYARKHHLGPMNTAKASYDTAVEQVKMIQDAIDEANNSAYKLTQQQYVADSLTADATGAVQPKDYTNYIYIGIAILAVLFFWKQSK